MSKTSVDEEAFDHTYATRASIVGKWTIFSPDMTAMNGTVHNSLKAAAIVAEDWARAHPGKRFYIAFLREEHLAVVSVQQARASYPQKD